MEVTIVFTTLGCPTLQPQMVTVASTRFCHKKGTIVLCPCARLHSRDNWARWMRLDLQPHWVSGADGESRTPYETRGHSLRLRYQGFDTSHRLVRWYVGADWSSWQFPDTVQLVVVRGAWLSPGSRVPTWQLENWCSCGSSAALSWAA